MVPSAGANVAVRTRTKTITNKNKNMWTIMIITVMAMAITVSAAKQDSSSSSTPPPAPPAPINFVNQLDAASERYRTSDPPHGDFLAALEWHQGEDDISAENDLRPNFFKAWSNDANPLGPIFAIRPRVVPQPEPANAKPGNPTPANYFNFTNPAEFEAKELGSRLVEAYDTLLDPTMSTMNPVLREYTRFMLRSRFMKRDLQRLFATLDLNGDGLLDDDELAASVANGYLTTIGVTVVKSWDVNYSKRISFEEFSMGPLFIALLESHPQLFDDFRRGLPGSLNAATKMFRGVLGKYLMVNPISMGLIELSESSTASVADEVSAAEKATVDARIAALHDLGMAETEHERTVTHKLMTDPFDRARFESARRQRRVHRARVTEKDEIDMSSAQSQSQFAQQQQQQQQARSAPNSKNPSAATAQRYKSIFGVPSESDERCVLCQYIYQRIDKELERKVLDDYTAFDDYPKAHDLDGGFPGLEQMTGRATGARYYKADLVDERGQRTSVRMIREVGQVIMRKVCGDSVPYLFRAACRSIWINRRPLSFAIFRRLDSGTGCAYASQCRPDSYIYSSAGVHYGPISAAFNGARGVCGMMNGPKANKAGAAGCAPVQAVSNIKNMIGLSH